MPPWPSSYAVADGWHRRRSTGPVAMRHRPRHGPSAGADGQYVRTAFRSPFLSETLNEISLSRTTASNCVQRFCVARTKRPRLSGPGGWMWAVAQYGPGGAAARRRGGAAGGGWGRGLRARPPATHTPFTLHTDPSSGRLLPCASTGGTRKRLTHGLHLMHPHSPTLNLTGFCNALQATAIQPGLSPAEPGAEAGEGTGSRGRVSRQPVLHWRGPPGYKLATSLTAPASLPGPS
jgi:hypothetical protein